MNVCERITTNMKKNIKSNIGNRNYIIDQVQKKQNYQTALQEDEYNLQMEQYIKDIINLQNQYPNQAFYKIVNDYVQNI
jgi:hypothetical protein